MPAMMMSTVHSVQRNKQDQRKNAPALSEASNEAKPLSNVVGQGRYANASVSAAEQLQNLTLPHEEAIKGAKFVANKTGETISAVSSAVGDAAHGTAKLAAWTMQHPRQAAAAATSHTISAVKSAPQNTARAVKAGGKVAASGGNLALMRLQTAAKTVATKKRFFVAKSEDENKGRRAVREIVIYLLFMIFYVAATMGGLTSSETFYLTDAIREQFAGVEMHKWYAPTFPKTFRDVATVEEYYHWLDSAFKHSAFSPNTFDGGTRHTIGGFCQGTWHEDWAGSDKPAVSPGGTQCDGADQTQCEALNISGCQWVAPSPSRLNMPMGSLLQFNKIIGAVRISQLRSKPRQCSKEQVPSELSRRNATHDYIYTCYGGENGAWNTGTEDVDSFGNYTPPSGTSTQFLYDGIQGFTGAAVTGDTVASKRSEYGQSYSSSTIKTEYDAPSHAVLFDPSNGVVKNGEVIAALTRANYIDLRTRAVFIDLTIYNPMVDQTVQVRLLAETPTTGGVKTSYRFTTVRLYTMHNNDGIINMACWVIVALFYVYYTIEEVVEFYTDGPRKYFKSTLNIVMVLNITLFVLQIVFRFMGSAALPGSIYVDDGTKFVDFRSAMYFKTLSNEIGAINTFMNWFKMIAYLSYVPTFALLTDTLSLAAPDIFGFSFVFFIIFFGFAQAHTMVFNSRMEEYRNIGDSMYMLLRSLLGDFNFEDQRVADPIMGPFLFVLFICLAVFVILNMVIAIISDAYSQCREKMNQKKSINIVAEITLYVRDTIESIPCVGPYIKAARLKSIEMAKAAEHAASKAAARATNLAAKGTASGGGGGSGSYFGGRKGKVVPAKGKVVDKDGDRQVVIDDNDDGVADAVLKVDSHAAIAAMTGIKMVDGRAIDTSGDGKSDMVAFSQSGANGAINTVMEISTTGMDERVSKKAINAELISTDADGRAALVAVDTKNSGQVDTVLKVASPDVEYTTEQLKAGQKLDVDGDGIADLMAIDSTGDGHLDLVVVLDDAKLKIKKREQDVNALADAQLAGEVARKAHQAERSAQAVQPVVRTASAGANAGASTDTTDGVGQVLVESIIKTVDALAAASASDPVVAHNHYLAIERHARALLAAAKQAEDAHAVGNFDV
eukprot:g1300.t1